jgi:hypothetical protein
MSHKIDLGCPPHPQRRGVSSRLGRFIERGDSHEIEAQRGTRHERIGGGSLRSPWECSILIGEESVFLQEEIGLFGVLYLLRRSRSLFQAQSRRRAVEQQCRHVSHVASREAARCTVNFSETKFKRAHPPFHPTVAFNAQRWQASSCTLAKRSSGSAV